MKTVRFVRIRPSFIFVFLAIILSVGRIQSSASPLDWEIFDLVPGSTVQSLIDSGRLEGPPTAVERITNRFDTFFVDRTDDHGDDYGSRIRGFLQAPQSGAFRFYIRSDDASQLSLGTNHLAESAQVIARETSRNAPLFGGSRIEERRSAPIFLEKGRSYFFEVLHKESAGSDFVEVGWETPDGVKEHIPTAFLLPWAPEVLSPQITVELENITVGAGQRLLLEPAIRVQQPATFHWLRNGVRLSETSGPSLVVDEASVGDAGQYQLEVFSGNGQSALSEIVTVSIEPDTIAPLIISADLEIKRQLLTVRFSERISAQSVSDRGSFNLNNGIAPVEPVLSSDGKTLAFKVNGLTEGQSNFVLSVRDIVDQSGNALEQQTQPVTLLFQEGFNRGPGFFVSGRNNQANGNSFGFSESVNAGGPPGEFGGRLTRSTTVDPAFLADATLGGPVSQRQRLVIRSKLYLKNQDANGQAYLGYSQTLDGLSAAGVLGLRIGEPNSSTAPNYRGLLVINGKTSPQPFPIPPETVLDVNLEWDPVSAVLSGQVGEETVSLAGEPGDASYQAFFLGAFGLSSANPSQASLIFVDNLTYANGAVRIVNEEPPPGLLVDLISPAERSFVRANQPVTLKVNLLAVSESAERIEYFAAPLTGAYVKVGESLLAPHEVSWIPASPGQYRLSAKVITNEGTAVESDPIPVSVVTPSGLSTVTEPFDQGLGRLNASLRLGEAGNVVAYGATSLAGGSAGELSATFARTTLAGAAYIADTQLGAPLYPAFQPLILKGRIWLKNIAANGSVFLGYADKDDLNVRLGLRIAEPGGATAPNFRGSLVAPGGSSANFALPQETPLEFDLQWHPEDATLSGKVNGQDVSLSVVLPPAELDALILGAYGANGNDPAAQVQIALDDLAYNIAAPADDVPALTIGAAGTSIQLSWIGTGFKLQSRASLSTGAWVDTEGVASQEEDRFTIHIQPSGISQFWRIIKQ